MIPFDADGVFRPASGEQGLRQMAVRGAAASVTASALSLAAQLVSTMILARILTPSDFGVVAMATTFSLLVASFGLNGFTEAVIQFEEIDHYTASNLFWINSVAGLILAVGFAASGTLLARFYDNPLIASVAVGLSVGIFIAAISVIHLALLKRAMRFTVTSTNDVVGRTMNTVVAVLLALAGWGYWALVAGIIAQQLSVSIGGLALCRWRPSLPRRTEKTGAAVLFAARVYGQFSAAYATRNVDNLLVGWRFNAAALGYFKKAFDLFALSASQLTAPLHNVALAALSRVHDNEALFRRYLIRALGIIAFVGMATSADLTLVGNDVVRFVLGPKWAPAGTIFEIFGPGIGAMLLCSTVGWIHLAIGKPERWLRWTLFQMVVTTSLFMLGLRWGPAGVAGAWSISFWAFLFPSFWYAGSPIGFGALDLLSAIWRYVASAVSAGLASAAIFRGTYFRSAHMGMGFSLEAIVIVSMTFLPLYLGAVVLFHGGIEPLRQFAALLQDLGPSKMKRKPNGEALGGL